MTVRNASDRVRKAVSEWPGISESPGRFGAIEFKIGEREIGHIHGNRLIDVPFPRAVHDELINAGLAKPHHVIPDSGWVSFWIENDADVAAAIALLRRSFDLIAGQLERRKAQSDAVKAGR